MNLQLTKKLADQLKVELVEMDSTKYNAIENYHCNLLKFGRDFAVLITNDTTLFSFFIYPLRAKDFKNFESIIKKTIFKILIELGFSQEQFEKVLSSLEDIQYSKTHNRKVLGSMNNITRMIESFLYSGDDLYEINRKINKIPYSKLSGYAINLYKELL